MKQNDPRTPLPLAGLALACLAWPLLLWGQSSGSISAALQSNRDSPSRIVVVSNHLATSAFLPNYAVVEDMVQTGLTNLTGQATPTAAWNSLVSPDETIGIKVLTQPGPNIGTRIEVTRSVIQSMITAGIPPTNIVVWDKNFAGFRGSGYLNLTNLGVTLTALIEQPYDEDVFYEHSLIGTLLYTDHEFGRKGEGVGRRSFVSKLITEKMDKIVLISPLLNHNQVGVCGNLYSLAMGSIDNTLRFERQPGSLAVAVPEVFAMEELGDRVVLNIVDALVCQYQGQERGLLHYSTALNELRFSKDPVALDVLSIRELNRQRQLANIASSFTNLVLYNNAALLQIGASDPSRILIERFP